jgi:hypothetical protein
MHPSEETEDTGACLEMPRYKSHKQVWALEIDTVNGHRLTFREKGYASIMCDGAMFTRYSPVPGDFYVQYDDGYKSFSPRKAFAEGYAREVTSFKERVVEEEKLLSDKLNKLGEFIQGRVFKTLAFEDQTLLQEQDNHMRAYVHVLRRRIERFSAA